MFEVDSELGNSKDLEYLVQVLHEANISLILDLPLHPIYEQLQPTAIENLTHNANDAAAVKEFRRPERSLIDDNAITSVVKFWLSKGVDGFYMKGLENFATDQYLGENLREWKYVLGKDRIMIVNQELVNQVSDELADEILQVIDLVDVFLDVSNGTQLIEHQVTEVLNSKLKPSEHGPWIHWSINGIERASRAASNLKPNASLPSLLMEMMLPGTPSIFYGDEILMQDHEAKHLFHAPTMSFNEQGTITSPQKLSWLPKSAMISYEHLEYVTEVIALRKRTPSLYKNSVFKNGNAAHGTTHIRANKNDLLIIERTYPRRNTFVSITNLGPENLTIDISALYYSGQLVLGPAKQGKVLFSNFKIRSLETVIIRLDK